jgi:hypothetical protein
MTQGIQHFLIVYDHRARQLKAVIEFGEDDDEAMAAYAAKEKEFEGRSYIEIVLVGSDSIDTVKLTHANYFDESLAVSRHLAGLG